MSERKAKSPYQRYSKTPFRYSEAYQRWKAAVMRGDKAAADRLSRDHMRYLRQSLGWSPDPEIAREVAARFAA